MTDTLLDVEPTPPMWRKLMEKHKIKTVEVKPGEWAACLTLMHGDESERDAVIGLIRKQQLDGWKEAHQ